MTSRPQMTAEMKRQGRERDAALQQQKAIQIREREAIRRRRLGVSLLTGPGGETGTGGLKRVLGSSGAGQ